MELISHRPVQLTSISRKPEKAEIPLKAVPALELFYRIHTVYEALNSGSSFSISEISPFYLWVQHSILRAAAAWAADPEHAAGR